MIRKAVAALTALTLAACAQEPIEWAPPRDVDGTIGATTRLVLDPQNIPNLIQETNPSVPVGPHACPSTLAVTRAHAREWYAAWFIARTDSNVTLVVARSTDGGAAWNTPVVADDRDRGRRGCGRPAPALHADTTNGYIHAAYFIEPREGAGVWYTHSMERGAVWHQTIGVLFGETPSSASLASAGDLVLVAYEHPGARARLGVAISRQTGHTFAERMRVVRVSGSVRDPRIAIRGDRVALAWVEQSSNAGSPTTVRTRARLGRLR